MFQRRPFFCSAYRSHFTVRFTPIVRLLLLCSLPLQFDRPLMSSLPRAPLPCLPCRRICQCILHFILIHIEASSTTDFCYLPDHQPPLMPFRKCHYQTLQRLTHHDRPGLFLPKIIDDTFEVDTCLLNRSSPVTTSFLRIFHHLISPPIPFIRFVGHRLPISPSSFQIATPCSPLHPPSLCLPPHHPIANTPMIRPGNKHSGCHTLAHGCVSKHFTPSNALSHRTFFRQTPSNEMGAFRNFDRKEDAS